MATNEVILIKQYRSLGQCGELVKVKSGFARNFLIPKGFAIYANEANLAKYKENEKEHEKNHQEALSYAQALSEKISNMGNITFVRNASEEGRLYGSVTKKDIAQYLKNEGYNLSPDEIEIPNLIKEVGEYKIEITLYGGIENVITIQVLAAGIDDDLE